MDRISELIRKTAWWAPLSVLVTHRAVMWMGLREQSDNLVHFLGGVAIGYWIWTLIPLYLDILGEPTRIGRLLMTLFAGCTVALVWDLTEFASDELLGTHVQHSLRETMLDLTFSATGVLLIVAVLAALILRKQLP